MANFRGETVLVTLREPKGSQVRGLVTDVVNQQLNLRDVLWLPSQERTDYLVVHGPSNLLDIEIVAPETHTAIPPVVPQSQETCPGVEDPAILSYGRPPQKQGAVPSATKEGTKMSAAVTISSYTRTEQDAVADAGQDMSRVSVSPPQTASVSVQEPSVDEQGTMSATLTGPFEELGPNDGPIPSGTIPDPTPVEGKDREAPVANGSKNKKKKPKKAMRKELLEKAAAEHANTYRQSQGGSPESRKKIDQSRKNSGWRETPFLEEAPKHKKHSLDPSSGPALKGQRQRRRQWKDTAKEQNGWATEDATDIQEMGDFDFSGNLSKFDKHETFNQFRQEDTTADEERLVTHNRLPPRAGTAGGKNLHHTENVLSPKVHQATWNSGDSENDLTDAQFGSGRSSHRNRSRASVRQPPSRKSSVMTSEQHMTGSGSLAEPKVRPRPKYHEPKDGGQEYVESLLSSGIIKHAIRQSEKASTRISSSASPKPTFRLTTSGLVCPCPAPLQMLELEQLAMSELSLTEDVLTENAARGIIDIINQSTITKLKSEHSDAPATVVILAGNNKTGARAIAAARQALNHPSNIILTVLGHNRDDDLLEPVRRQLNIYRNCGGQLMKPERLITPKKNARVMPDVIIDALLGMHMAYDDLKTESQDTYLALANWANDTFHNEIALIASIDIPSGLDASSGAATQINNQDHWIRAAYVLSLGAPKTGLLAAGARLDEETECIHFVADIGLHNSVWQKLGTRYKEGVAFGPLFVASLEYRYGDEW